MNINELLKDAQIVEYIQYLADQGYLDGWDNGGKFEQPESFVYFCLMNEAGNRFENVKDEVISELTNNQFIDNDILIYGLETMDEMNKEYKKTKAAFLAKKAANQ